MSTSRAIVVYPEEKKVAIRDVPIPEPGADWVLVKVKAVALNPTDFKSVDSGNADVGSRIGCDYAGVVEKVGSNVTKFQKGDRIAGFSHGGTRMNHDSGAFGEWAIAKEWVSIKIPDLLSFEQAATLGVAIATCGQGLYKSMKLPFPNSPTKEAFPILIYGGSTATGLVGIQYAKASGLTVIATASPSNFDLVKSVGADSVFDYNSPTAGADIRALTKNKLKYAWDCTGNGAEICCAALSDAEPSFYGTIIPVEPEVVNKANPLVDGPHFTLGYDAIGEKYMFYGNEKPIKPDEVEFATKFFEISRELLASGTIKPIVPTINKGGEGLEGVLAGLEEMRAGRVRGAKLVYTI